VNIGQPKEHQELGNFLLEKGYKTLEQNSATEDFFVFEPILNNVQLIKNVEVKI
jgi:hypothetical protein